MARRSTVWNPEALEGYARKAGLPLSKLWEKIEAELNQRTFTPRIVIRGPKQTVTKDGLVLVKRDSLQVRKVERVRELVQLASFR
jgi:hypothetical protein